MPSMNTFMDRQKLVGWIVRDGITGQGISYTDASRRWPMSLPTLNRLMTDGNVGLRFYAIAEKNLNLPRGLLSKVADGDTTAIRDMPDLAPTLREFILRELGEPNAQPNHPRRTRKAVGS